jgi:uncharacterized protein CbrC (UPF0167 family)
MAKYTFECEVCENTRSWNISISEFLEKKEDSFFESLFCSHCSSHGSFRQKFKSLSSKIKEDKQTMIEKILDDSKRVAEKVRSGDQKAIRDIYGDKE